MSENRAELYKIPLPRNTESSQRVSGVRSQTMKDHLEGERRLDAYWNARKMGLYPNSPLHAAKNERRLQEKAEIIGRLKKKGLVHEV